MVPVLTTLRVPRLWGLTVFSWILLAFPGPSAFAMQVGQAPDGRPGFGARATVSDVRGLFQSPSEAEAEFLSKLQSIESDILVLAARFEKNYEDTEYFDLLARGVEPTLAHLHAAWFARWDDPLLALREGKDEGRAFARMCADTRFRVRARLLLGAADEFRELNGALNLMRAHFAGYADLNDKDIAHLGLRTDVAASVLRALRLDLDALRGDEPPDEGTLAVLVAFASGKARGPEAVGPVNAALDRMAEREERMLGALFSARPSDELTAVLEWRDRLRIAAERVLEEVLVLSPLTPEGREAPVEVEKLGKSKRHDYAARTAVEGLSFDLMNEELNRLAGESIDFQWGGLESRRWFDRYLALRGIRSHDNRSYDYKKLDEHERRALERVQAPVVLPPR
jgi:hypothetical protein